MVCFEESPCAFCRDVYPVAFSPSAGRRGCRGERREAGIQWIQPPKAVSDPEFRQTTSGTHGSAGRADCLPRGKPPGFPAGIFISRGFFANYGPKVSKGERREASIQWIQPPKAVSAPEFRQTTSGAHGSAGRADCLPRGKPPVRPQAQSPAPLIRRLPEGVQGASGKPPACSNRQQLCRKKFPLAGPDAPTPARIGTCRPKGRSHFSFGGERKVCKRKPAARRLREKGFYCPF